MTLMIDFRSMMVRRIRLATVVVSMGFGASIAHAQSAAPSARPWFADVSAAATVGHRGGSSIGVEGGRRVGSALDIVAEAGRMYDVGTSDLDARAQRIANVIGASSDPTYRVTYADAGVRFRLPVEHRLQPYAMVGAGAARVTTIASFSTSGDAGVRLGPDLTGTITKPYLTAGGGAVWNIGPRYALDASYRYGYIVARTGEIERDTGIDVHRLRLGAVIRF